MSRPCYRRHHSTAALYPHPTQAAPEGSSVIVAFEKGPGGGVGTAVEDEGEGAQGIATCFFRVATDPEGKQGMGSRDTHPSIALKAEIQILGPAYRFVFFSSPFSPPPLFPLLSLSTGEGGDLGSHTSPQSSWSEQTSVTELVTPSPEENRTSQQIFFILHEFVFEVAWV